MDIGQGQPHRVLELWFEDANVIFQAESSLFRVHKGILQARSSVFRDMFAIPQTSTPLDSDLMDGCIVTQLPDAAEDIRCFFLAIGYDASFFEPPPTPTPLSVVLAIARMSHKYDVPFLRRRALSHLSHRCPTTLRDFFTVHVEGKNSFLGEEFEVLRAALKIDPSWVLPYQFLITHFTELETLLATQQWKDLEVEIQAMCHVKWRCIESHSRRCIAQLLSKLLSDLCATCAALSVQIQRAAVGCLSEDIPMFLSPGIIKGTTGCCPECLLGTYKTFADAYGSFWDALPETLGMPRWDILETKKSEDTEPIAL